VKFKVSKIVQIISVAKR